MCGVLLLEIVSRCSVKCLNFFLILQNKQVLELITIPNAFSNIGTRVKKRCHFYAGDWSALADNIAHSKYDFILTSETIYNTTSYPSLIAVLKKAIKRTGIVYPLLLCLAHVKYFAWQECW
ncbi:hypothetical protein MRX96_048082 [Rhipicephalus microplus]